MGRKFEKISQKDKQQKRKRMREKKKKGKHITLEVHNGTIGGGAKFKQ